MCVTGIHNWWSVSTLLAGLSLKFISLWFIFNSFFFFFFGGGGGGGSSYVTL